ncbi:MAG TPA: N-acetylmuramoyl-L-alanine amidase [Candidatus Krumholzibacteria bacterium]|nr:N-acetylmuramoyl-L-alanine amidase [Candidatus Krumholzibacteria bacterium]
MTNRGRSTLRSALGVGLILPLVVGLLAISSSRLAAQDSAQKEFAARSARINPGEGRPSMTVTLKQLSPPSEEWYIAGSDLADALQVGRFWRADVRKLVLRLDDLRVTFTAGARSVVSEKSTILLRTPVVFHQGEPWIPMEFFTSVLPQLSDKSVRWNADDFTLNLGVRMTNVEGLSFEQGDLYTQLVVKLNTPLAFRVDDSQPRQLIVKLYGARISPGALTVTQPRGLVDSVEARQYSDYALLTVHLSELVSRYQSLSRADGREIVLKVMQEPITTIPEPVPRGPKIVQTLPSTEVGRKITVRRVIIDAGHGGADDGKKGVGGLLEKDVTLAIALELKRELQGKDGIEVFLTRDDDSTVGLIERTEFANQQRGDLFLSIHCNGWYAPDAKGVETYFLSPAKTQWDSTVAREENLTTGVAEDVDFIVWDLVQNQFIQESATLAEEVQEGLSSDLKLDNRGVKQAGFRVLVGAYMPAILVEVAFLSNPQEAKLLASRDFHRRVAHSLARAILKFRDRMEAVREEKP